ncbi:hypothetical protein POPTR_006G166100v4 [Populus trichocarpa]|uniref:Uncharacterized protein n=1 Tax=Populus trichocarpa TaxID=3694 RepID=A0ACC0SVH1_POPTR|nr:hypothetical protein POPTR_006G166100v4 [Populus trichocarpa]
MGLFDFKAVQDSSCRAWKILERQNAVRFQQHHSGCTVIKSKIYQENNAKFLVHAASGQPPESGPESTSKSVRSTLDAFYRFSRPHTVIGTVKSKFVVQIQQRFNDHCISLPASKNFAVAAALMMNIYIVGLNQLTGIEIDKVNKPYLPVASGEYSVSTGVMIVTSFSIMFLFPLGILIHCIWRIPLKMLIISFFRELLAWINCCFVLGTAYSINLPLLRWKRFAFIAAMCIPAVRAVIVQLAFYLHMQPLIFATSFMSFFSVVIALFKEDIPDIEGDKIFGIQSCTVRLGQKWVFWTCISLLEIACAVAILVGAATSYNWSKCITVLILGHAILASMLWNHAKSVDLKSKASIISCYMFIWKLFYAEYLLIPLVR